MFVRDFTEVAEPQQRVVDGLSTAENWSSAIVDALDMPDREVLARYGMLGLVGNRSGSTEVRVRSVPICRTSISRLPTPSNRDVRRQQPTV